MLRRVLATALATLALPLAAQTPTASPYDFIDAFRALSGEHKGIRKGHAKGVCAQGEFVPSEQARTLLASPFSGAGMPAQLRFSMAGGNPRVPDSARSPRGLAAQFQLPDGTLHHLAMLSTPVFGAKDPDSFLGLLRAQRPGPDGKPDAGRIAAYREAHPDTRPQAEWLASNPPPGATPPPPTTASTPSTCRLGRGTSSRSAGICSPRTASGASMPPRSPARRQISCRSAWRRGCARGRCV
jgi:catalase